jgi:hypothetical protein
MKHRYPSLKRLLKALTVAGILCIAGVRWGYERWNAPSQTAPADHMPVAAASATPRDPAGDQLITRARNQLERRASISAKIGHRISFDGRELRGGGYYFQQGSGETMHVRLEISANSDQTGMLQISNGRFLWTDQHLPTSRRIIRLDLGRIRNELNRDEEDMDELRPGAATWSTFEPEFSNCYGGLPALLGSFSDHFEFDPPQAMRWTPNPPIAGLPESLPVFALVGHWRPEVLAVLLPEAKPGSPIPARLPQEVMILFGQSDLFPYRIEYRPRQNPSLQFARNPVVVLELSEVNFDAPIAAGQFDFSPGEAEWDDRTAEHIELMRQARQVRLAAQAAARR